jgi:hypothetical protein
MEWLLVVLLVGIIAWLMSDEKLGMPQEIVPRKRLCDYYAGAGRLREVHVYSDEQDQPIVSSREFEDSTSFEQVCVDLVNDAFPSKDPFILSIVLKSDKVIIANRVAEHLQSTVRRHLFQTTKDITQVPIDSLANKLILVSGGNVKGTELEPLINLCWTEGNLRRLTWHEAAHPRDETELVAFNKDHISLVAPDPQLRMKNANPDQPKAFGCQWNLFDQSGGGFVEKPHRGKTLLPQ